MFSPIPGRHGKPGLLRKLTDTSSEIRREFGPRLHHQFPEAQRFSVGLFCARKASVGAILGSRLRSVVLRVPPLWAGFWPLSSLYSPRSSGASPPGSLFGAGLRGGGWSWRLLERLGTEIGRCGHGSLHIMRIASSNGHPLHLRAPSAFYTLRPDCSFSILFSMEPIYLTAFVGLAGAISTLLGVSITSRTQITNQQINNQFQLALAQEKARNDSQTKSNETAAAQLAIAHKLLSHIAREFSVTGLNIMWTASMSVDDFNAKYMALCEKADELRMIVDFHAPEASEVCDKIYGQMNMFWGNFGNVLHLTATGKKIDHNTSCFQQAHEAAREIGEKAVLAKNRLRQCFESYCVAD